MNNADDIDSLMPEVQTEDMGSTEENNNMPIEIEKDDTAKSAFKSAWSKYRAVKECLPKTPQKRASIISQLATSPSCRVFSLVSLLIKLNVKRTLIVVFYEQYTHNMQGHYSST
jgi:hypothetical protein